MEVISLTEGKINRTYIAGKDVITKQSSFDEIKNIEIARKALTNKTILLENDVYMFHLPKIYDYKDGCIFMEFLQGDNLELDLRNSTKHQDAAQDTNDLFQYMYENQILWKDFAPRNIIIDRQRHIVNLCDFERGIASDIRGKQFLQNYVYEEYAAFLLPYERKFPQSVEDIFNVDERHPVEFDNIKSKRVKSLIEAMCLPKDNLNSQTIANMNKMIVMAETPYKKGGQLVFPIIELEQIKDRSYSQFAKCIVQINKTRGNTHGNGGRL